MANQYSLNPMRGMRDFLPAQLEKRNAVLSTIRSTVSRCGFSEIETPCVEDIHKLRSDQGGENESMVFEILKRGIDPAAPLLPKDSIDCGLRYDLTLPLSRYYAHNRANLPTEFRVFQTGSVWRAERPQKGRFRQFRQCDIDIIGSADYPAEIEVLSVGAHVLKELRLLSSSTLFINDRRLLDFLLDACRIPGAARAKVLIELDKLDKMSKEKVAESIANIPEVKTESAHQFLAAIEELSKTESISGKNELMLSSLDISVPLFDMPDIIEQLRLLEPDLTIQFSPSLVRGMGYYTGTIYEVKLSEFQSSICGGGRYDHMIGKWLGKDIPAVGFSFGFERLIDFVDDGAFVQSQKIALGYKTTKDHLAALTLRQSCNDANVKIGLVKLPSKLKSAFFEGLIENNYSRLIMPQNLQLPFEEALQTAKVLD